MSIKRTIGVAMIAAAVVAGSAACTITSTGPDEAALVYNSGPMSATTFQNCVGTGSRDYADMFDTSFTYPAGQRTYVFSESAGETADRGAFGVADRDGVPLSVPGQMRFQLNTDCDTLVKFHEKIGIKYGADWAGILNVYLQQPLNRAITEATQGFGWRELYSDPKAKAAWEQKARDLLPTFIKQATGEDYFTNLDLVIQKPGLPAEISQQLVQKASADESVATQEAKNEVLRLQAAGAQDLIGIYGADNAALLKLAEMGVNIPFIPIPQGSPIVVGK